MVEQCFTRVSLDSKVDDVFYEERYNNFREYCRNNGILHIHQIESVDFVMFKNSFNVSEEERYNTKKHWENMLEIANGETVQNYGDNVAEEENSEVITAVSMLNFDEVGGLEEGNIDQAPISDSLMKVLLLIKRLEQFFSISHSYISVYSSDFPQPWNGLSDEEIILVDTYSNLFYKFTARRFVLIKWIMDGLERLFEDKGYSTIDIETIYLRLGNYFGGTSFNRGKLRELFEDTNPLTYDKFSLIRDKYLSEYYKIVNISEEWCEVVGGVKTAVTKASSILNPKFKARIADSLGEEMFSSCVENPEKAVVFGGLFRLAVAEFDKSSGFSSVVSNRLCEAKDVLGEEVVIWCLKNYKEVVDLIDILKKYEKVYEDTEKARELLKQSFDIIDKTNLDGKIYPLIVAAKIDNDENSFAELLQVANVNYIKDLNRILSAKLEEKDFRKLIKLAKWLAQDKKDLLKSELECIFKKDRDKEILRKRATGNTLEETGQHFNLTRERVRQLEKTVKSRFNNYVTKLNPHFIIFAFSKHNGYFSANEIKEWFGDLSDIFIYCLKEIDCSTAYWINELDGFIIGDGEWYRELKNYTEKLPDTLDIEGVNNALEDILKNAVLPIEFDNVRRIVLDEYSEYGKVYLKKRLSLSKMYLMVLEKYYPDGIKLYDEFETMRFRGHVRELFGDVKLPGNNRAIDARIADLTVLCDRGKYILPSRINIPDELLKNIHDTITDFDRDIMMFTELFERFKEELLESSNVNNKYFLQGVLKLNYSDQFYFTRDTICKLGSSESSIKIALEDFIKEAACVVSKDDIKAEFRGITEIVLSMAVSTNPNLILWDFGQYLHASVLSITNGNKERIQELIERNLLQGHVTSRKLFDVMYIQESDFLGINNIHSHYSLFGVLTHLFNDEYEFRRPFIFCKGSPALSRHEVIRHYLDQYETFAISELRNYLDENQIKILSIEFLLEEIRTEFLRASADLCVKKSKLNLSQDVILMIEKAIVDYLGNKGYVSLRKINDFFYYPEVGIEWTPYLLESIIYEFSEKFKIIELDVRDYRYVSGIVVDVSSGLDTYEDIIRDALKRESEERPFDSINEMESWLKEQELIIKTLPNSLFDKGIIYEDEYERIRVS